MAGWSQVGWNTPRQEDLFEFKASLVYLKTNSKKKKKLKMGGRKSTPVTTGVRRVCLGNQTIFLIGELRIQCESMSRGGEREEREKRNKGKGSEGGRKCEWEKTPNCLLVSIYRYVCVCINGHTDTHTHHHTALVGAGFYGYGKHMMKSILAMKGLMSTYSLAHHQGKSVLGLLSHIKTTCLEVGSSLVGWVLPHHSWIKKILSDGNISQTRFLFPDNSGLC